MPRGRYWAGLTLDLDFTVAGFDLSRFDVIEAGTVESVTCSDPWESGAPKAPDPNASHSLVVR
jgi:hypothetical protein